MSMRRIICIFLALMTAIALASCGNSSQVASRDNGGGKKTDQSNGSINDGSDRSVSSDVHPADDEVVFVAEGSIDRIIDKNGRVLVDGYKQIERLSENEFIVEDNEYNWKLITSSGNVITDFTADMPIVNQIQSSFRLTEILPTANPELLIASFYNGGLSEISKLIDRKGLILSDDTVFPSQRNKTNFFLGFRDVDHHNIVNSRGVTIATVPDENTLTAAVSSTDKYACIMIREFYPDSFDESYRSTVIDDRGNTIIDYGEYSTLVSTDEDGVFIAKEVNSDYFKLINLKKETIKEIPEINATALINDSSRSNLFFIDEPYTGYYMNAFTGAKYSENVTVTKNPNRFIEKSGEYELLLDEYGETVSKQYLKICQTYYPNVFVAKKAYGEWEVIDETGNVLSVIMEDTSYYKSFS